MKNYFIYDHKPSSDFNTFLASTNLFDAPEEDVAETEVPGRNGNIIVNNNRYKNFTGTATVYIPKGVLDYADHLKAFLLSRKKYCRYEDTFHPEHYRMARYTGPFSIKSSDRVGAAIDLEFNCNPQIYLKSGEIAQSYTGPAIICNTTYFDAQPLIRVYGYGSVYIGEYTITVGQSSLPYVDIDCELMNAYYGDTNCNNMVTRDSVFTKLVPGESEISMDSTVNRIDLTPRWWTI